MTLFRPSDKRVTPPSAPNGEPDPGDPSGVDDDYETIEYVAPAAVIRARLELMGYSLAFALRALADSLASQRDSHHETMRELASVLPSEHTDDIGPVLDTITPDTWTAALREVRQQELSLWSVDKSEKEKYSPILRFMLDHRYDRWYGFECYDIRTILRLAVEACPDDDLVYDLTELITGGYYDSSDDLVADAEQLLAADFALSRRVVVLTEGATDKWILERSLRLLRPDLYDFFTFMDFAGARVAGGAGALASIVKAFVAAGILNRVVAVFDNDTAGAGAMRDLASVALPPNIAVVRLPDLALAREYPTRGPSGEVAMDVNGLAASLELYLGCDVLTIDGQLLPVQWKGFDERLKQYQGEVTQKGHIHERFRTKLASCEQDATRMDETDWSGLEIVATVLCAAFAEPVTESAYAENPNPTA